LPNPNLVFSSTNTYANWSFSLYTPTPHTLRSIRFDLIRSASQEDVEVMNVGKIDPKRHLANDVSELMALSIVQCLGTMIDTVVF
jgi:hypothetical protein